MFNNDDDYEAIYNNGDRIELMQMFRILIRMLTTELKSKMEER